MSNPNIVSVQTAAQILGVHPVTITRAIKDGRLHPINPPSPILKRARAYLLSLAEVETLRPKAS